MIVVSFSLRPFIKIVCPCTILFRSSWIQGEFPGSVRKFAGISPQHPPSPNRPLYLTPLEFHNWVNISSHLSVHDTRPYTIFNWHAYRRRWWGIRMLSIQDLMSSNQFVDYFGSRRKEGKAVVNPQHSSGRIMYQISSVQLYSVTIYEI